MSGRNITLIAIGFIGTLVAACIGCYKYRERSYFLLLRTADAIDKEANPFTLGAARRRTTARTRSRRP
ncbi:hypothetical protein ACGFWE_39440 [Streptomyces sp. NPDC048523]|uniref:hypothetical protein n=1 Tax=Streptomyces sp. NPDC048523 TaxID=3365567 RepID=UPI00370F84BD